MLEPMPPTQEDRERRVTSLLSWLPARFRHLSLATSDLSQYTDARTVAAFRAALTEAEARGPRARSGNVVLIGPAGSGKTALAAAWLADRIRAGADGARWIPEIRLAENRDMCNGRTVPWEVLAEDANPLVLDDVGKALAGAPVDGGIAAMRRLATVRVLQERYDRGLSQVITTSFDAKTIVKNAVTVIGIDRMYDDGVARRIYEDAAVVRC